MICYRVIWPVFRLYRKEFHFPFPCPLGIDKLPSGSFLETENLTCHDHRYVSRATLASPVSYVIHVSPYFTLFYIFYCTRTPLDLAHVDGVYAMHYLLVQKISFVRYYVQVYYPSAIQNILI